MLNRIKLETSSVSFVGHSELLACRKPPQLFAMAMGHALGSCSLMACNAGAFANGSGALAPANQASKPSTPVPQGPHDADANTYGSGASDSKHTAPTDTTLASGADIH